MTLKNFLLASIAGGLLLLTSCDSESDKDLQPSVDEPTNQFFENNLRKLTGKNGFKTCAGFAPNFDRSKRVILIDLNTETDNKKVLRRVKPLLKKAVAEINKLGANLYLTTDSNSKEGSLIKAMIAAPFFGIKLPPALKSNNMIFMDVSSFKKINKQNGLKKGDSRYFPDNAAGVALLPNSEGGVGDTVGLNSDVLKNSPDYEIYAVILQELLHTFGILHSDWKDSLNPIKIVKSQRQNIVNKFGRKRAKEIEKRVIKQFKNKKGVREDVYPSRFVGTNKKNDGNVYNSVMTSSFVSNGVSDEALKKLFNDGLNAYDRNSLIRAFPSTTLRCGKNNSRSRLNTNQAQRIIDKLYDKAFGF